MMKSYTADFETTTDPNDCRVWEASIVNIEEPGLRYQGFTQNWFWVMMDLFAPCKVYFHNLKFDGEFMLYWLFGHGFAWTDERPGPKQFSTLISDMGEWYQVTVCLSGNKTIHFLDSLKLINKTVEQIAVDFGLPVAKGTIDYTKTRPVGYVPTQEEREYGITDTLIMAYALNRLFKQGLKKMTIAGNAMGFIKRKSGPKHSSGSIQPFLWNSIRFCANPTKAGLAM